MNQEVEYLDLDDVLWLAEQLLGTPAPIRDIGLLGAAVARPQTTLLGADAYPDIWSKVAALLQSLLKNHALVDGNRRLAWLATAVFLELNEVPATAVDNDTVFDVVMTVAAGSHSIEEIAARLEALC